MCFQDYDALNIPILGDNINLATLHCASNKSVVLIGKKNGVLLILVLSLQSFSWQTRQIGLFGEYIICFLFYLKDSFVT